MFCRFINGFINRKKPLCPENIQFVQLVQYNYLIKLRDHVPKNVLDKSWLQPPSILEEVRVAAGLGSGEDGFCSVVTCVHASCRKRAVIFCWLVLSSGMMAEPLEDLEILCICRRLGAGGMVLLLKFPRERREPGAFVLSNRKEDALTEK